MKRFEVRVSKADRDLLDDAADHLDEKESGPTRKAAATEAQRVLARSEVVTMPADRFDALLSSLDSADDAPVLRAAFERPRRFTKG